MHVRQRPSRAALVVAIVGMAIGSGPSRLLASEGPPPVLNPKIYTSTSGQFAIYVNPGDMLGRGGALYRLTKGGQEVWSGRKAFTLWDAAVTDDGVVTGYTYSHGWRGFSQKGIDDGYGDFRVLILDPNGGVRMEQVTNRQEGGMHSPPNPLGQGLILDAARDRVIIRMHDPDVNHEGEMWRTYRLSDGKPLVRLLPF
jgi:hypothetical protein